MDRQQVLIDRALEQLSEPALAKLKSSRPLEQVLVSAQKTGKIAVDDLGRATKDLVEEANIPSYFAKSGDAANKDADGDTGEGLAFLFLLLLLSILAALAPDDTDTDVLIKQLIEALLDSWRSGGS